MNALTVVIAAVQRANFFQEHVMKAVFAVEHVHQTVLAWNAEMTAAVAAVERAAAMKPAAAVLVYLLVLLIVRVLIAATMAAAAHAAPAVAVRPATAVCVNAFLIVQARNAVMTTAVEHVVPARPMNTAMLRVNAS